MSSPSAAYLQVGRRRQQKMAQQQSCGCNCACTCAPHTAVPAMRWRALAPGACGPLWAQQRNAPMHHAQAVAVCPPQDLHRHKGPLVGAKHRQALLLLQMQRRRRGQAQCWVSARCGRQPRSHRTAPPTHGRPKMCVVMVMVVLGACPGPAGCTEWCSSRPAARTCACCSASVGTAWKRTLCTLNRSGRPLSKNRSCPSTRHSQACRSGAARAWARAAASTSQRLGVAASQLSNPDSQACPQRRVEQGGNGQRAHKLQGKAVRTRGR